LELEKTTCLEARRKCRSRYGAKLVKIDDDEEKLFINNAVKDKGWVSVNI
jgi:hypothetical protein